MCVSSIATLATATHQLRSFVMALHTASFVRVIRTVVAALVASAICVPASIAQTHTRDRELPTITVNYSDLNLSTVAGSRALYSRLVAAAERVCPEKADTMLALRWNRDAQRCVTRTVERAVKDMRNTRLAEVAASYTR
jgi:UrcA family protein